jgi:hypothetical protein
MILLYTYRRATFLDHAPVYSSRIMTDLAVSPAPRTWKPFLVGAVLAINVVLCVFYPFKQHSDSASEHANQAAIRHDWRQKCAGNIFILFSGFDDTNVNHQIMAASVYFNAVYALTPSQTVYVATPHTVINNGRDILTYQHRANMIGPDLFAGLEIRTVALATMSPEGGVNVEFNAWRAP